LSQAPNGAIPRPTARHSSNNLHERRFIVKHFYYTEAYALILSVIIFGGKWKWEIGLRPLGERGKGGSSLFPFFVATFSLTICFE
jgi:hypothetical protein